MNNYRRLKIYLTDGCNINCAHCYLGPKTAIHANLSLILRRIKEAKDLGVQILDLTGGEPTIHPDFCAILDMAGRTGFERINLSTNGLSLAKSDILPHLETYNVHCNISLDGGTKETVDAIRGRNVFRRLEKVFIVLSDRGVSFAFRFSINKLNKHEIREMLMYAEKWGVNVDLEPTQLVGNASKDILLERTQALEVKQVIEELKPNLSIVVEESFTTPIPCDGGFSDLLSLNIQGVGVTCLMMKHEEQKSHQFQVESIEDLSLATMWERIQEEKQQMREFRPAFSHCPDCEYYGLCQSGCWVTAHSVGCFDAFKLGGK